MFLEAFFWSGEIFSGIENKDEGQRMEAVGKEQCCEEVTGFRELSLRDDDGRRQKYSLSRNIQIASHLSPLVTVPSRQKHVRCPQCILLPTAS